MANSTKRIVCPISGRVIAVQVESNPEYDAMSERFTVAKRLPVLNSIGSKSHITREQICNFIGNSSRRAWNKSRRDRDANSLKRQDKLQAA